MSSPRTSRVASPAGLTLAAGALLLVPGCDGPPQGAPVGAPATPTAAANPPLPARSDAAGRAPDRSAPQASRRPRDRQPAPVTAEAHAAAVRRGFEEFRDRLDPDERRLAATVVVRDIGYAEGEPAFLYEQMRKAAGKFYFDQTAGSRAKTEANRKRAEREAVAGSGGFGGMVWYNYQIAEAEIGRSRVMAGPELEDERVYYLFPVSDLDDVAAVVHGVREVSVDPSSRTAVVRSVLPGVLPDGEPDKLADLYPEEKRVRVVVKYDSAGRSDADRQKWVRRQAGSPDMTPGGDQVLSVAKHRWLSEPNRLTLTVAPVEDVADYRERITWGEVTEFDERRRTLEVVAKIPPEDLLADRSPAPAMGGRDDREPAAGEAKNIWAARVLKESDDYWARKEAFEHLAKTLPEEATEQERAVIGDALLFSTRSIERNEAEQLVKMLILWQPEGFLDPVRKLMEGDELWHHKKQDVLRELADSDDTEVRRAAAEIAVDVADDTWMGKAAVEVLRELGADAEDALLDRLTDPEPKTRRDVAILLGEVGTKKSADRLLAQSKVEQDRDLAKHMRSMRAAINRRLMAQRGD